jgi:hypothetical protein
VLQAQLLWLTRALPVLYSCVVLHVRQAESPLRLNWPAPHPAPQTVLLVAVHAAVVTMPAHEVQAEHGVSPVAFQVAPAAHGVRTQARAEAFQL